MAFQFFQQLPYELRLQIWEDAFDAAPGRVFHVPNLRPAAHGKYVLSIWNAQPQQAIALACHESWTIAEGFGTVLLGSDSRTSTRFRPSNDILFLDDDLSHEGHGKFLNLERLKFLPPDSMAKVEIIGTATWELTRLLRALGQLFPSLKRLVYVSTHADPARVVQATQDAESGTWQPQTNAVIRLAPDDKVSFGSSAWSWQEVEEFLQRNLERAVMLNVMTALPTVQGVVNRQPQRYATKAAREPTAAEGIATETDELSPEDTFTSRIRTRRDSTALRLSHRQRLRTSSISLVQAF